MPLTWTPELNTGIRIIDLQHRELIDMINELEQLLPQLLEQQREHGVAAKSAHASTPPVHSPLPVHPLLLRLQQYVLFHFAHEEGLMLRQHIATPHSDAHLAQHAQFAEQIATAISALDSDQSPPLSDLLAFLQDWLVQHIMGTDKALAALMRK